jgi:hypothetical protein
MSRRSLTKAVRSLSKPDPDMCPTPFVWMGAGGLVLEGDERATRADHGGKPFYVSWKWLVLKAKHVNAGQLLTVPQYESRHGKLPKAEG